MEVHEARLSYPPPFSQQPPSQHPTLGVHRDKSEWFHCIRIHTIVNERLGLPENKAI
jgi:hypothetical protein